MRIDFASPPPHLAAFVSIFYRLQVGAAEISGVERAEQGHVRLQLKGRLEQEPTAGESPLASEWVIHAPQMRASHWRIRGDADIFGFALTSLGWALIVRVPAHQVSGSHLCGKQLFEGEGVAMLERLRRQPDLAAMVEQTSALIDQRLHGQSLPPDHGRLIDTVERWLDRGDAASIDDLFAALPWSSRQTTRLVNHYFGGPPKLLQRRARALRATTALLNGARSADVLGGFYDQPHMINEIKAFTGCTPSALRRPLDPFSMASLNGRLAGQNPMSDDQIQVASNG